MDFTPYLTFNGTCAEAFRLYERVFGGRILVLMTHGESPIRDEVPPDLHERVLHAALEVDGRVIMGSDTPPQQFEAPQGVHVSIAASSVAEGERLFAALAEGGRVTMPFQKTFWSPGFAMLVDRFGIPWMVNSKEDA